MGATSVYHTKSRKPAVAGLFYPGDAAILRSTVEKLIKDAVSSQPSGTIHGIIAPHAGYIYSGYVAAEAFRLIGGGRFDTVIVISPSHRDYFSGVSVYTGPYETPLGIIEPDIEVIDALVGPGGPVRPLDLGHREEHGIEVELPFLQVALGNFKLVPLVMGTQDRDSCRGLGELLMSIVGSRRVLLVASSDLSHFYDIRQAQRLDHRLMENVEAFDEEKFLDDVMNRKCEACGYGTIMATMMACRKMGSKSAKVLSYHTSGDVSGDYKEVVGYLSAVFYGNA